MLKFGSDGDAGGPRAEGARLLVGAALAWRARARRDPEGCRRHVAAALAAAFPRGLDGPVAEVAPLPNTAGGFFCAIAIGAGGGRYFTKGILGSSREAAFWRAWRDGAVRVEGRHYRIEPPVAVSGGRAVMVLAFPERAFMRTDWRTRDGIYARNVRAVARAVAEFNAGHAGVGGFAAARGCRGCGCRRRRRSRRRSGWTPARRGRSSGGSGRWRLGGARSGGGSAGWWAGSGTWTSGRATS